MPQTTTTIASLAIRIITSSDLFSGTSNDVYFDIGPLGWKIDGDFSRGGDTTIALDLHGLAVDISHIVWIRLEKKGILGFSGTPELLSDDWRPERVELVVDGTTFISCRADVILTTSEWYWMNYMPGYDSASRGERLVNSLRLIPNNPISGSDETIAAVSTNFKKAGISGWMTPDWLGLNLPPISVVGMVLRPSAESTDGLATIDLRLELVDFDGIRYYVDGRDRPESPGVGRSPSLQRYIRVEFKFRNSWPLASGVLFVPDEGQRVRVSGDLMWDSDQEGWYEIHNSTEIEVLGPSPIITGIQSSFSETQGAPESETYHWPGCSLKVPSADCTGPRDFTYEKVLVYQRYEITVTVQDYQTDRPLKWSANGQMLSTDQVFGGLTLRLGSATIHYAIDVGGLGIVLWNDPEDASSFFELKIEMDDPYEPTERRVPIMFDGTRITYEPDYYRCIRECNVARFELIERLKTVPQPVPKYDPGQISEIDPEELVSVISRIGEEAQLGKGFVQSLRSMPKSQLVSTLFALIVRYPEQTRRLIAGVLERGK